MFKRHQASNAVQVAEIAPSPWDPSLPGQAAMFARDPWPVKLARQQDPPRASSTEQRQPLSGAVGVTGE